MPSATSIAEVTQDYTLELLRSGPAVLTSDINSWASEIDAGFLTPSQVALAFGSSVEAIEFVLPIEQIYAGVLGRVADAGGLNSWVNVFRSAVTSGVSPGAELNTILSTFVNSVEFANKYAGGGALSSINPTAYVTSLYGTFLGRSPDSAGLAFWVGQLTNANGTSNVNAATLVSVTSAFLTSTEYAVDSVSPIENYLANAGLTGTYASLIANLPGPAGTLATSLTLPPHAVTANNFTNVFADLSPFSFNGIGPTLVSGDVLSNVVNLTITDEFGKGTDLIPAGAQLTNITNVILKTVGNAGLGAGTPFDTTGITGVATLAVTSAGAGIDYINAASTTAISATQNSQAGPVKAVGGAGVQISGGSNVTVSSGGGIGVVVGNTTTIGAPGFVPATAQLPTGAVIITENNAVAGKVNEMGGTTVFVTVTSGTNTGTVNIGNTGANTGDNALGGATNPTGTIAVIDTSNAGGGGIIVFGGVSATSTPAVSVSSAGQAVTVGDATAKLLSNQPTGAVAVGDNQLVTYNDLGGAGNNKVAGGSVTVIGGTNVVVSMNTGGQAFIGNDSTKAGTLATGTITLANTASDLNGPFAIGGFASLAGDFIVGGTFVNVSEAGGAVTIGSGASGVGSINNTFDNPTAAVVVTETVVSHQIVAVDGGVGVTVNAEGQAVNIGLNTGAAGPILVNQSAVLTGNGLGTGVAATAVKAFGGSTVTVNTTGGNVFVGSGAVGNGSVQVPTGAVAIIDTFSGANSANSDQFSVLGGTTVNITVANSTSGAMSVGPGIGPALNVAGTALKNLAQFATGNVTILNSVTNGSTTTYGTSIDTIFTAGATTVSITGAGSGNTIADVNAFGNTSGSAVGTSTLTTVNLDGVQGTVAIDSNAVTGGFTLSIADSLKGAVIPATAVTIGKLVGFAGFTAIPAHALALTLNNDTNAGTKVADATATAVTVTTGASAAADNIILTTGKATAFTFNNAAALTVGAGTAMSAVGTDTIMATGAGALNLGDTVNFGVGTTKYAITTSDAAGVTVTINGDVSTFAGGTSGNNVVTIEDTTGLITSPNGGSGGNNTLIVTNAQSLYTGVLGGTIFNNVTNFQTLGFAGPVDGQPGANGTYDVSGFGAVTVGAGAGSTAALTLTNAGAGEALAFTGNVTTNPTTWQLLTSSATAVLSATFGTATTGTNVKGVITQGLTDTLFTSSPNPTSTGGAFTGIPTVTINSIGGGAATTLNTVTLSDVQGLAGTAPGTLTININGNEALTLTDGDKTVTAINASASTGAVNVTAVAVAAAGASITGGSGLLTASMNTEATPAITDVDILTTGSGGGTITLGAGGAGQAFGAKTETVNLQLSSTARDTITALTAPVAGDGTRATINGFVTTGVTGTGFNRTAGDVLSFAAVGGTAPTVFGPNTPPALGASVSGSTYTVANGVFTLVTAKGAVAVPATAATAELTDVQTYVDATTFTIGAVQIGGNTYVIDSGAAAATPATDTVIQLSTVTGITGFAFATDTGVATSAGNSIDIASAAGAVTLLAAANGGSAVVNTAFADTGFSIDTWTTPGAVGITNTYNFGNFAELQVSNATHGNAVVNMTGTAPELIVLSTTAFTLDNLTYNGALVLDSTGGAITVTTLTDTGGTDLTIWLTGANPITIPTLNDAGLTLITATNSTAAVTLGGTAALSQAGLTVLGGTGLLTVTASGAGDTITDLNTSAAGSVITANGGGDTINAANGANTVTANGAADIINLGVLKTGVAIGAAQTIHANGAGDTITFATAAADGSAITWTGASTVDGGGLAGIGINDTVNFGTSTGTQTITITGDLAGATTSGGTTTTGIAMTNLGNVAASPGSDVLVFTNQVTEKVAGASFALSQVNVTSVASLAQAFDLAAAEAALSQQAGLVNTPAGVIGPNTGVIDWFQFGGNTYVVEAINATAANATHTALAAGDEVVKIVGLVDLSATGSFNGAHNITL